MSNLLLKLHAWYYRRTGIFTNYAKRKEQEYLNSTLRGSESQVCIDIITGCWQAKNGFYRIYRKVKK